MNIAQIFVIIVSFIVSFQSKADTPDITGWSDVQQTRSIKIIDEARVFIVHIDQSGLADQLESEIKKEIPESEVKSLNLEPPLIHFDYPDEYNTFSIFGQVHMDMTFSLDTSKDSWEEIKCRLEIDRLDTGGWAHLEFCHLENDYSKRPPFTSIWVDLLSRPIRCTWFGLVCPNDFITVENREATNFELDRIKLEAASLTCIQC